MASGTTISKGGLQQIASGGKSVSATVFVGGTQIISAGVLASATTVSVGGTKEIESGGKGISGTVDKGTVNRFRRRSRQRHDG